MTLDWNVSPRIFFTIKESPGSDCKAPRGLKVCDRYVYIQEYEWVKTGDGFQPKMQRKERPLLITSQVKLVDPSDE